MSDDDGKYFKSIMDNIITSSVHGLPAMHALNLTTGLKITKLHAEELIADWSDQGYFVSMDDVVHPGPRLISEFSDILRTKYKEHIHTCYLCKQIIFQVSERKMSEIEQKKKILWILIFFFCFNSQGQNCPHECECLLHKRCSIKYFKKAKRCPKCRNDWKPTENME